MPNPGPRPCPNRPNRIRRRIRSRIRRPVGPTRPTVGRRRRARSGSGSVGPTPKPPTPQSPFRKRGLPCPRSAARCPCSPKQRPSDGASGPGFVARPERSSTCCPSPPTASPRSFESSRRSRAGDSSCSFWPRISGPSPSSCSGWAAHQRWCGMPPRPAKGASRAREHRPNPSRWAWRRPPPVSGR